MLPDMKRFTLFHIAPQLVIKDGSTPGTPQRCSRGHTWNFGFELIGVSLDLTSFGLTDGPEEYCFICLRDMLREKCGRVQPF